MYKYVYLISNLIPLYYLSKINILTIHIVLIFVSKESNLKFSALSVPWEKSSIFHSLELCVGFGIMIIFLSKINILTIHIVLILVRKESNLKFSALSVPWEKSSIFHSLELCIGFGIMIIFLVIQSLLSKTLLTVLSANCLYHISGRPTLSVDLL